MKIDIRKFIFYENEDYIALNKPPNISTLFDRQSADNLLVMMRSYDASVKVCHRLDKETSGVLIFAKSLSAYKHLSFQFEHREVRKVYHAIIEGHTDFSNCEIDFPLRIPSSGRVKIDKKLGKPSKTSIKTLEAFRHHTLMECIPESGRKHQIRAHLAFLSHPIASDKLYGGSPLLLSDYKKRFKGLEQPMMQRAALHASAIQFKGMKGEKLALEASYPKDFKIALQQIRKYN